MDDRRVPDLEAMDEEEATRLLTQLASALSPEGEYQIRPPEDYLMEMPQSGERFRGRENVKTFQKAFTENSAPPSIRIRRVLVREALWVVESIVNYGGGQLSHGGGHPRTQRRQGMEGHPLLRRAFRRAGVAVSSGRADGDLGPVSTELRLELRLDEVRRIPLPRPRVNKTFASDAPEVRRCHHSVGKVVRPTLFESDRGGL